MTIARWSDGKIYEGQTAYRIDLLKSGKYAISEQSAIAMGFDERLCLCDSLQGAVAYFGRLIARHLSA